LRYLKPKPRMNSNEASLLEHIAGPGFSTAADTSVLSRSPDKIRISRPSQNLTSGTRLLSQQADQGGLAAMDTFTVAKLSPSVNVLSFHKIL
jgi:hypothetical protein